MQGTTKIYVSQSVSLRPNFFGCFLPNIYLARMAEALRRLLGIVFLVFPILAFAQTKMIVYDGISGIYNTMVQDDTLVILNLVPKSPAQKAGIQFRDQIVMINDSVVAGQGLNSRDIKKMLNGRSGELIDLTIKRNGEDSLLSFSFMRDPYLYQISTYDFSYLVDSLEQWDIHDIMSESLDSLFTNPLIAKCRVYSVEEGSPAEKNGILAGDQVISLADEMDRDYEYHISQKKLSTITSDSSFTILRDDSVLYFNQRPSMEGSLKGIRSQFDRDLSYPCVWLKITTENRLSENRTYLISFPEIEKKDSLNLYMSTPSGEIIEKRSGITIPPQNRDFIYKNWRAFKVPLLKDKEQTFYFYWKAEEHVEALYMDVIAHDTIVSHDRTERLVLSGFFGMMFIMSCFFLILFIANRRRSNIYFSLYILSLGVFLFVTEGYLEEYLWKGTGFLEEVILGSVPFLISAASIFFLLLGIVYLDLKQTSKWWYRSVLIVIGLIGIRLVTLLLESIFKFNMDGVLEDIILITWAVSISILPLSILILPAIMRIRNGFQPAWYFLMANIVLIPLAYITLMNSDFSFTVLTMYEPVLGKILHVSGVYIAAVLQMLIFSIGLAQKMRLIEKEKEIAQERIIDQMKDNDKLKDKVNRELEGKVKERTREINEQKEEIESQRDEIEAQRDMVFGQKKEITDSISYAQRIQAAVLPHKEYLDEIMSDYFVFYKPRDIVSGDFYWIKEVKRSLIVVAADCTGHGVPGAVMSMLGITLLNEQLGKNKIDKPGEILDQLRVKLKAMLDQQGNIHDQKDGLDMAIVIFDKEKRKLQFAGANNPLYLVRNKGHISVNKPEKDPLLENDNSLLFELKGDKQPIGVHWEETDFTSQQLPLQKNDTIYVFTDGYVDQFGGENRKKFKTAKFRELLLSVQGESMESQKQLIENAFDEWRGSVEQIDDVCVIGVRI